MKRMHVRCAREGESSCYLFEVETARGKRRVYPPGIRKNDEAATTDSDVLRAWFKKLDISLEHHRHEARCRVQHRHPVR